MGRDYVQFDSVSCKPDHHHFIQEVSSKKEKILTNQRGDWGKYNMLISYLVILY